MVNLLPRQLHAESEFTITVIIMIDRVTNGLDLLQHVESFRSSQTLSPRHLLLNMMEDGNNISQTAAEHQHGNGMRAAGYQLSPPLDFNISIRDRNQINLKDLGICRQR
jgi:hypothetical protein